MCMVQHDGGLGSTANDSENGTLGQETRCETLWTWTTWPSIPKHTQQGAFVQGAHTAPVHNAVYRGELDLGSQCCLFPRGGGGRARSLYATPPSPPPPPPPPEF